MVIPYQTTDFGEFVQFEPLTLCPIDKTPIDLSLMTNEEIGLLNDYHRKVYDQLAPYLDEEEREWLACQCEEIGKSLC
jgi:Xaa-Pro aminopeptidase